MPAMQLGQDFPTKVELVINVQHFLNGRKKFRLKNNSSAVVNDVIVSFWFFDIFTNLCC